MKNGEDRKGNTKMTNLLKDYVKNEMPSGGVLPDFLQVEIDTSLLSWKLEVREAEHGIAHNHDTRNGEDAYGGE